MKRLSAFIIPTLLMTFLSGCQSSNNSNHNNRENYRFIGGDLIFTELYVEETYANRAVEIANVGNKEIDLNQYYISIYRDGGSDNVAPTETISLSGTLGINQTFVIAYDLASQKIKDKANLISDNFLNDGSFPMTINKSEYEIVDFLGKPGYFYDVASGADAVKKKEHLQANESFSPYDWIRYPTENLDHLGNLDCLDNETIFNGPKLEEKDFSLPYARSTSEGGGGLLEVTLLYTIDGDTTKFNFGNSLSSYGIRGSNSLRYYGINTPEISHGGSEADPYGPEARDFTNDIINRAKHFLVQSVAGYSLTETYGRILGFLWVTFLDDPKPEDYFLLNHYVVRNGYARVGHVVRGSYSNEMTYKGISYVEYLFDAKEYAIANKLHIYEEGY